MYNTEDVMRITGYKESKARSIIQKLNEELKREQPDLVCFPGRVQKKYFDRRVLGIEVEDTKKENGTWLFSWLNYIKD